jgi:hypothetical protein
MSGQRYFRSEEIYRSKVNFIRLSYEKGYQPGLEVDRERERLMVIYMFNKGLNIPLISLIMR